MSIRDDFFAAQAKASLWDVAVSIKRGNPLPLDANSVFKAYGTVDGEDYTGSLLEYATSNPVAYPGQICAVVGVDSTTIYYLDQNLAIQPVGIIPTGDSKTIEVTTNGAISLLGAAGAANGTLPMIGDDGKLTWKTLEDIGAGDGNDDTTYEFSFADQKITITPKFNGQPIMEGETQVVYELDLSGFVTSDELGEAIKDFVTTDTTYSVKTGEKILKLEGTEFSTVASLKYIAATEDTAAKIQLCGIDGGVVSEIDATPFIKDGMLENVEYNADNNTLTFTWNTAAGITEDTVVLSDIIEPYTAGDGLNLSDNEFAVKVDDSSESFLTVSSDGVKLSGIQEAINTAKSEAATDAQNKADAAKQSAIDDAATKYYNKSEIYTKGETDSKIDEKIASVTGGESAADVKLALESYRNAANTEIWGPDAANWTVTTEEDGKTKVTYTPQYGTKSRIDALEEAVDALESVGAQANVIEEVKGTTDNKISVTTSGKIVTIDDTALRTDIATAQKAGDDAKAAAQTNADAITGHDTRIQTLERANNTKGEQIATLIEVDTAFDGRISDLETAVNNETTGIAAIYAKVGVNTNDIVTLTAQGTTHGQEIATLKTLTSGHTTDIQNINSALGNIYTKNEIDGKVGTINTELGKKLEASDLTDYIKSADVAETYATIASLNEEAATARAAEKANADAIAVLLGNIEGDKQKSVRNIAKEEVALIVGTAPEAMDTLEEVANWISNDESGSAAMANDIAALKTKVDTGDKTVSKFVEDAIEAKKYSLPIATAEVLGGIKSASLVENKPVTNKVYVNSDGVAEVTNISTDSIVQGSNELILYGGNAGTSNN